VSKSHRLRRLLHHRRTAPGAAPGALVADPHAPKPIVQVISYGTDKCHERELRTITELKKLPEIVAEHRVTWINVQGLGDIETVRKLGELFDLHPLALEDALGNHQRSKVEQYGDTLFIVARMLEGGMTMATDQLGMFLGKNFVITFQHLVGDCFDPLRERIRRERGIICTSGPDYLAYAILDGVVDSYFPICEGFGDYIETLEEEIIRKVDGDVVARIHTVKSKLLILRKAVWPLRDALHMLVRDPIPLISDDTRVYLRDCADHTFQIIDLVETYRELSSNLMDLYHSALSSRTNEVMQVLTVIATIFIPLTFIVGVYGMNFDYMPELRWKYGYFAVWGVMLAVAGGLLWFFQRRGWLPRGKPPKFPLNDSQNGDSSI
jgi:magnesium transporter